MAEDFDAPAFDARTYEAGTDPDEPLVIPPQEPPLDLDAIRDAAYSEGVASALSRAMSEREEAGRQALSAIADRLADACEHAAAVAEQSAEAVSKLLLAIVARALPAACARQALPEICAVMQSVLPAIAREPQVTIRVSPHLSPLLEVELRALAPDLFARITLIPTDALAEGDVRIGWQDGAAVRSVADIWPRIAGLLAPFGIGPEPPDAPAAVPATRSSVPA